MARQKRTADDRHRDQRLKEYWAGRQLRSETELAQAAARASKIRKKVKSG